MVGRSKPEQEKEMSESAVDWSALHDESIRIAALALDAALQD